MKRYRIHLSLGLLALAGVVNAADTGCPAFRDFQPGHVQGTGKLVLDGLATPLDQAPATLLTSYLEQTSGSARSSDYVLRNYARIAVAAGQLQQQSFDQARQTLAQVELDSPAAVKAALMLAESYRIQGQHSVAGKWMLRIAERYSSNPEALSGLLLAADDSAEGGDIATALAVYSRVLEKTLANIDEIGELRGKQKQLYEVVISGRIDNTQAVSSEVIQRTLRDSRSDNLQHYARLKRIDEEMACLEKRQEELRETRFTASLEDAGDSAFATMLTNERKLTVADIEKAEAAIAAASPYDDIARLEQTLNEAREALATIDLRLAELQARQPDPAEGKAASLAAVNHRVAQLEQARAESRDAINASLNRVLDGLLGDYREMAGEAQLGRAHMKQLFSRVGSN